MTGKDAATKMGCPHGRPSWHSCPHCLGLNRTMEPPLAEAYRAADLAAARDEFLAASIAVWREIDRLDTEPEGYHPVRMSVALRQAERAAWERYRDLLPAEEA
jgi:hypothetical protein